jgi:predicted DNA-binding WGR domain protein
VRKCFQLIEGNHYKFWTVEVVGNHYLATFGRIGTQGQTQVKTFGTEFEATGRPRR